MQRTSLRIGGLLLGVMMAIPTRAIIPVIDAPALAQLIQEVAYWQEQIAAMQTQLEQLRQTYAALTGPRGFQNLVVMSPAQRNYLPGESASIDQLLGEPGATVTDLAAQINARIRAHAIVSDARLAELNAGDRAALLAGRQSAAAMSVMAQSSYQHASERFAQLQQFIAAVGETPDAKASADLQARIAAEATMLQNEQSKLSSLFQLAQTQLWANQQARREQVVVGHGQFAHRFEPTP